MRLAAFAASLFALTFAGVSAPAQNEDLSKLKWETNWNDPPIGDPEAKRGGTLYDYQTSFPLTFRIWGPNSNDAFAAWNRAMSIDIFAVVGRHPTTDNFIPILAKEWAIMPDQKTVYYRIDLNAKWSDGKPIVAEDYAEFDEFLGSEHLKDPFYRQYIKDHYESVTKVADDVIKVVGKNKSWRPLSDLAIYPIPRHSNTLDATWDQRMNYTPPVVPGPYVISSWKEGERLELTRLNDWWGDKHPYLKGMYNPDKIVLKVINDTDAALNFLKKGEISVYTVTSAKMWATEMDFPELKKGWIHKKRVWCEAPEGLYGLAMNTKDPLFQNKDFRKAMQHLFNFEELNKNLMYNAYIQKASIFTGTEYEKPGIKPYPFDPKKAREHLKAAGFDKRGPDGILVRPDGTRASFEVIYGTQSFTRHMTVIQNMYKKAGVEMKLQLLEGATNFKKGQDKAYQMHQFSRTANFYPDPHQYFHSEFADVIDNNNVWGYKNPEVDKLIEVYRWDLDIEKRKAAMHQIEDIIADEALLIPFFYAPFIRWAHWDYVKMPKAYFPRRTQQHTDYLVMWIDEARQKEMEQIIKENRDLGEDTVVDIDGYGVKEKFAAAQQ